MSWPAGTSSSIESMRAELGRILDVLAAFRDIELPSRCFKWACPRCRARVGAACVKPDGDPLRVDARHPGFHAGRIDLMCAGWNSAPIKAWRDDMKWCVGQKHEARELRHVLEQVQRSKLYRQLRRIGEAT